MTPRFWVGGTQSACEGNVCYERPRLFGLAVRMLLDMTGGLPGDADSSQPASLARLAFPRFAKARAFDELFLQGRYLFLQRVQFPPGAR